MHRHDQTQQQHLSSHIQHIIQDPSLPPHPSSPHEREEEAEEEELDGYPLSSSHSSSSQRQRHRIPIFLSKQSMNSISIDNNASNHHSDDSENPVVVKVGRGEGVFLQICDQYFALPTESINGLKLVWDWSKKVVNW